ncbi:MAG: inorganic diphosphatase, partial [Lachnospiraceae bacterium]|nr:inorganic diphosphatase [Lachnospiraceae bacterium]
GLLLAAILSDTLMFRSPTCTDIDREMAAELSKIAGVDAEELALSMFEAASDFGGRSIRELFYQDFKTFQVDETEFGVSQISAVSDKQLSEIKTGIQDILTEVLAKRNLNMVYVLLTNILDQNSLLLYEGTGAEEVARHAFPREFQNGTDRGVILPVVSRKKQFVPLIISAIQEEKEG